MKTLVKREGRQMKGGAPGDGGQNPCSYCAYVCVALPSAELQCVFLTFQAHRDLNSRSRYRGAPAERQREGWE